MPGRGGYQAPAHPAPTSGPGALSARTDGGPADRQPGGRLANSSYGETKDMQDIQSGAPLGQSMAPPEAPPADSSSLIPLDADSARPDEPVTAGADAGAGPGMSMLGLPSEDAGDLQGIIKDLPMLEWYSNQPNASPSFKAWVRRIKGEL